MCQGCQVPPWALGRPFHQRLWPFGHRVMLIGLCLLPLMSLLGCKSLAYLPNIDPNRTIPIAVNRISHQPPHDATTADWTGDPKRLADDISRTVDKLYWGRVKIEQYVATNEGDETIADDPWVVVRAMIFHPDGRMFCVVAHSTETNHVQVYVRLGLFGDRGVEAEFLHKLQSVMKGKPKRKRGGTFELP